MTAITTSVRSRAIGGYDRLDANFYTSPGVAAAERVGLLEAAGRAVKPLRDIADRIWAPGRFARTYATSREQSVPYLRPYDVFDYVPSAADRLSLTHNASVDDLRLTAGTILQTCSGRNLGPCAIVDDVLAGYTLSHDMIRIEISDVRLRAYVLAFLQTSTGQSLLRRGRSGSVIDHLTVADVQGVPVPLTDNGPSETATDAMLRSVELNQRARRELVKLATEMSNLYPMPAVSPDQRRVWTLSSRESAGRLDAAFHDPVVRLVRDQLQSSGALLSHAARAIKPPRYRRFYVEKDHGRPVLSGRQLLQAQPVNLRHVSDRSFRDADLYVVRAGMTIFGAVGRAEGRLGAPTLVGSQRDGWLASEDVIRLEPKVGTRPGALWLATSTAQVQLQLKALTFGSVIDHLAAEDVDRIILPGIPDQLAERAEVAWRDFDEAEALSLIAARELENSLHC